MVSWSFSVGLYSQCVQEAGPHVPCSFPLHSNVAMRSPQKGGTVKCRRVFMFLFLFFCKHIFEFWKIPLEYRMCFCSIFTNLRPEHWRWSREILSLWEVLWQFLMVYVRCYIPLIVTFRKQAQSVYNAFSIESNSSAVFQGFISP